MKKKKKQRRIIKDIAMGTICKTSSLGYSLYKQRMKKEFKSNKYIISRKKFELEAISIMYALFGERILFASHRSFSLCWENRDKQGYFHTLKENH